MICLFSQTENTLDQKMRIVEERWPDFSLEQQFNYYKGCRHQNFSPMVEYSALKISVLKTIFKLSVDQSNSL